MYNDDNYNGKTIDIEIIANFFFNQSAKNGIDICASRRRRDMMLLSKGDEKTFST